MEASNRASTVPIVDTHVHLYQTDQQGEQLKQDFDIWEYGPDSIVEIREGSGDIVDTLAAMDEVGVTYTVALNTYATVEIDGVLYEDHPRALDGSRVALDAEIGHTRITQYNAWICELARREARVIPFIAIDPWVIAGEQAASHVRTMARDQGARGVKIQPGYSRFDVLDDRMWPVYEACSDVGIPIITHGGPHPQGYTHPRRLAPILEAFPDLLIILAHIGGPEWRQVPSLASEFANVWFEISDFISRIGTNWADNPTDDEVARLFREVGTERVMMGSDFPWYDVGDIIARVRGLPLLSAAEKDAILGLNAARLLRIEPAAHVASV